jgi:phage baseplate assembly protein W
MAAEYPFHVGPLGRTAEAGDERHIRDLIEQVLFTAPGERVNRPTFGSGLRQLLFHPLNDELATTTQFLVQGALQQALGDIIQVESVQASSADSTLQVTVQYRVRRTRQAQTATIRREV